MAPTFRHIRDSHPTWSCIPRGPGFESAGFQEICRAHVPVPRDGYMLMDLKERDKLMRKSSQTGSPRQVRLGQVAPDGYGRNLQSQPGKIETGGHRQVRLRRVAPDRWSTCPTLANRRWGSASTQYKLIRKRINSVQVDADAWMRSVEWLRG